MHDYYFNRFYVKQPILPGYVGAFAIIIMSFATAFFKLRYNQSFYLRYQKNDVLFLMVVIAFFSMLLVHFSGKRRCVKNKLIQAKKIKINKNELHLIISTLYRFSTLLVMFLLIFLIVSNHYYFSDESFQITKKFFTYLLMIYLFFGIPYIFLTLKYKWSTKYDFSDYAINLMLVLKGLTYFAYGFLVKKYLKKSKIILASKRSKKVIMTYLLILFFLPLMVKFLGNEFTQFEQAFNSLMSFSKNASCFDKYYAWYLMIYHLLFVVDVSLAIIGYTVASRWLDNRTRSVDMTVGGWMVAIMCYPPMNSGFTEQFISYNRPETHSVITSELGRMILMVLILLSVGIYVWATIALSFKFSNLTNRGIVTTGPYSIVRHPAYIAKNISWWLDNTFVLSNFWATVALVAWNVIYILRALTEERHLNKDPKYREYCKKVKFRFIPGLI